MVRIKSYLENLNKFQKISCLIILLGFIVVLSVGIPTLARLKNRNGAVDLPVWDGTVATKYKSGNGSENNPYIISDGSELAYFALELKDNSYEGIYFELSNNIKLNKGLFYYDETSEVQYFIKNKTYYLDNSNGKYYENITKDGVEEGTVNLFSSLENFKGTFNGNSYSIYGLFITDEDKKELSLFNNLEGKVNDLYVENAMIYGAEISAGIASSAKNSEIKNVLFNGYVVNKFPEKLSEYKITPTMETISYDYDETTNYIDLTSSVSLMGKDIISSKITGNYALNVPDENVVVKINDVTLSDGRFEIELGNEILSNVSVYVNANTKGTLEFSNLSYEITYRESVASGIVGKADNVKLENVVNKASIYGYSVSSGLVGITNSALEIKNSYNDGSITGQNFSAGLVGIIEKSEEDITVSKCYNNGNITGPSMSGLIAIINNNQGKILLKNIFNSADTNYSVSEIYTSDVTVENVYYTSGIIPVGFGIYEGEFLRSSIEDLETKQFIKDNLSYEEFVSFDDLSVNSENVWTYNLQSLPILFLDDAPKPLAKLHLSIYSWDNYSPEIKPINMNTKIVFSIEDNSELSLIKNKYYYISSSAEVISKEELAELDSWNDYEDIIQIDESGTYLIYVKIVDINNNISYINSDLLFLDLETSPLSIQMNDQKWTSFSEEPNNFYLDEKAVVNIDVNLNAEIEDILYYISEEKMNILKLNKLEENEWTVYTDKIKIDNLGNYIIYVKTIDKDENVLYYNTDNLIFNGYNIQKFYAGLNEESFENENINITGNSNVTMNINYADNNEITGIFSHNLMSNILLPLDTEILVLDNINNKIYNHIITSSEENYNYDNSCDELEECEKVATYPLSIFREVGAEDKTFVENSYFINNETLENFTVILKFKNIIRNYENVKIFMELYDENGKNIRPTLKESIKEFNIFSEDAEAEIYLNTDYTSGAININSESNTEITINTGINYKNINEEKILDTRFENKEIGISVRLIDQDENIVESKYLKTVSFKIEDKTYYPDKNGIIKIPFENGIKNSSKKINVITHDNKSGLKEGTYHFKINTYVSYNKEYYNELESSEISIPAVIAKTINSSEFDLNINIDEKNRIIKKSDDMKIPVNIILDEKLIYPTVTMALYKKDDLTAFNQNYTLVNLSDFTSNELNSYAENIYHVPNNNEFELNLIKETFENTGYKLVFKVYEENKRVATIEKYFLVK